MDRNIINRERFDGTHTIGLLAIVALGAAPAVVTEITTFKLTHALYFAVFVMSWDVVSGYTGQISFGHALFFGVGGYTSGMLNVHLGLPLVASIPAGVVMAALAGLIIGVPALRVRGPYLSLVTLVAPLILLRAFVYFSEYTGGEIGLVSVGIVDKLTTETIIGFYLAFVLFLFALGASLLVTRTDTGLVFTAIREDEEAVAAAGLSPAKFKIFAFVFSAVIGGLAGAVFAHSNVGSVSPSQLLALTLSIEVIIAAIVGGMGTITGAAVGGFAFWLFRDWLSNQEAVIGLLNVELRELDLFVFGVVTLLVLFLVPEGLLPRALRWGRRAMTGEEKPIADGGTSTTRLRGRLRDWFGGGRR